MSEPRFPGESAVAQAAASRRALGSADRRLAPVTVAALLALAAAAWVGTAIRMSGMDAGPGTDPGSFGFYISTWSLMMVAMMVPSAVPSALSNRDLRPSATTAFVAEYVAVWAAAGLLGYGALKLGRSLGGSPFAWHRAGRWTAAGVLLGAAAYELTPVKASFLDRCRRGGAGVRNGLECVGCCAGLMAALFALGAMSITWMIVISVIIVAQKSLPRSRAIVRGSAAILAALGIGLAAAPGHVPGLTVPGSPAAMQAMRAMNPAPAMHGMHQAGAAMNSAAPAMHGR